jgi:hypothetical protein
MFLKHLGVPYKRKFFMKFPRLKILDKWHGKENIRWVYSDDPPFHDTFEFLKWVLQHQKDYDGVQLVFDPKNECEVITAFADWNGFLHRHPRFEYEKEIPDDHVVVDHNEWMEAREYFYKQGILNGRKRSSVRDRIFCEGA